MWIMTTQGFVSAVEHREQPHMVMLRFRDPESARIIAGALGGEVVASPPEADYGWRTTVPKVAFSKWAAEQAGEISYENFKNACAEDDREYAHVLARVWQALLQLEPRERFRNWPTPGGDFLAWHEDWEQMGRGWEPVL